MRNNNNNANVAASSSKQDTRHKPIRYRSDKQSLHSVPPQKGKKLVARCTEFTERITATLKLFPPQRHPHHTNTTSTTTTTDNHGRELLHTSDKTHSAQRPSSTKTLNCHLTPLSPTATRTTHQRYKIPNLGISIPVDINTPRSATAYTQRHPRLH